MMETLFRGKRTDNNEWVEGCYFYRDYLWHDEEVRRHYILPLNYGDAYVVDPDTVGQYTGIMIDGERIYEDDIIKLYSSFDFRFLVQFGEYNKNIGFSNFNGIGFYCERIGSEDFVVPLGTLWTSSMEKIGNIHDNPELLW